MPHPVGADPVPLVVDTDIGGDVDDALAVVVAATHPRARLLAVTVGHGQPRRRAGVARAVLHATGAGGVPVGVGDGLSIGGEALDGIPEGMGDAGAEFAAVEYPPATSLLHDVVSSSPAPVHVCTIGPATNVAAALSRHPDLVRRIACVHVMGGALGEVRYGDSAGTTAPPVAEYNLGSDVLAAESLFAAPVPVRLVPLDVTMPVYLRAEDRAAISSSGVLGALLGDLMTRWLDVQRDWSGGRTGELAQVRLHDPITVAGLLEPTIERRETRRVRVTGTKGRAMTVDAPDGWEVSAVRGVDAARVRALVVDAVRAGEAQRGRAAGGP